MSQSVVTKDESSHRLDHWDSARQHTRVMPSASLENGVFARRIYRVLSAKNGGSRFERDAEKNGFTVADAALNAATAITARADLPFAHLESVIVFAAFEP